MAVSVDFSLCRLGRDPAAPVSDKDLKALGQRLIEGLQDNFVINLTNTGFSFEKLAEMQGLVKKFFSLPETTKMKYAMGEDTSQFHGYFPVSKEWIKIDTPMDFKEVIHLQALFGERDKDIFKQYYNGPPSDIEDISVLKVSNYLPLNKDDDPGKHIRCGQHKDCGIVTLLVPDKIGGLQYQSPNGEWMEVEPKEGAVCLQVGYSLEVLLSGLIKAREHRVVFKNDDSRLKARSAEVFFLTGPTDTVFKPLDGSESYNPFNLTVITKKFFNEKGSFVPE